jgi:hypothetical protein
MERTRTKGGLKWRGFSQFVETTKCPAKNQRTKDQMALNSKVEWERKKQASISPFLNDIMRQINEKLLGRLFDHCSRIRCIRFTFLLMHPIPLPATFQLATPRFHLQFFFSSSNSKSCTCHTARRNLHWTFCINPLSASLISACPIPRLHFSMPGKSFLKSPTAFPLCLSWNHHPSFL